MNFNIEEAIRFPFSEKDWIKKTGLYALGITVVLIVPRIIQFIFSLIGYAQLMTPDYNTYMADSSYTYYINNLVSSFSQIGFSLLMLPISLYLGGYLFKVLKNIVNKSKTVFPEHGNFWENLKLGFKNIVVKSGPSLVLLILMTPIIALIIVFASDTIISEGVRVFLYAALAGLIIITFIYMFVLPLFTYAMSYIFVKTESVKKSYSIKNIMEVVKYAWKEFYLLVGIQILVAMTVGVLSIFTICISWIATPILTAYTAVLAVYFMGKVFAELDKGVTIS